MGTLFRSHPDWKMCEIVDYNLIIQRGMVAGAGMGWAGLGGREGKVQTRGCLHISH